nr:SGNH/GDSL hydrolase family protein [Schlegelella koreensis]
MRKLLMGCVIGVAAGAATAAPYTGVYVFGDSLSDSGNLALAIGADPAQVVTSNGYIPARPYASGQFTNGNVWVRAFANGLGLASYGLPSLAGGGDFAFGGARTATDPPGSPPSLATQEAMFLGSVGGVAPGSALYVLAGGGNDARDALVAAATSANPGAVIAAAAAGFAQTMGLLVDTLQAAGAVDIIVWNIPNVGLTPAVRAQGAGATFLADQIARAMNGALQARLALESEVSVFDLYSLQNSLATNPSFYGLTNVADACGAVANCTPSSYLFWDGIHPTAAGHTWIAQGMLAIAAVPEPASAALVLTGLLLLGAGRRGAASRALTRPRA